MTLGRRAAARFAVDAGVVDHSVHTANLVDLVRERPGLCGAGEIANDHACGTRRQIREGGGAFFRARVQDHLVAFVR